MKKKKEISVGRVMDFSLKSPFPNIHSSPIGMVFKPSVGWQMITHLSYPKSQGMIISLLTLISALSDLLLLIQ